MPSKKVRFKLDEAGQIEETFKIRKKKTELHEINKMAVFIGAVAAVGLLVLAAR